MLGDAEIVAGAGFGGVGGGAEVMTTLGMFGNGVGVGDGDGGVDGGSGDGGSWRLAACSRMSATGPSSRSDPGAVLADNSGGDDAAAGSPACCWLLLLLALTNRSTSEGRAFKRGRNPTCIQGACVTVQYLADGNSRLVTAIVICLLA